MESGCARNKHHIQDLSSPSEKGVSAAMPAERGVAITSTDTNVAGCRKATLHAPRMRDVSIQELSATITATLLVITIAGDQLRGIHRGGPAQTIPFNGRENRSTSSLVTVFLGLLVVPTQEFGCLTSCRPEPPLSPLLLLHYAGTYSSSVWWRGQSERSERSYLSLVSRYQSQLSIGLGDFEKSF